MTHIEELLLLLRPAGAGVFTVSTGRAQQLAIQCALYGAGDYEEVESRWRTVLSSISSARVAIIGIPSDCGAGLVRGAAFGPQALRGALLDATPDFRAWAAKERVIDVGDVAVIPHLLSDEMVSDSQRAACQKALYPTLSAEDAAAFPVSPLSIAERVIDKLLTINPKLRLLVLGGDHSVAWPVVSSLARRFPGDDWGIVQPDAHTDLLRHRLGVKYCFATWAYHANELLGRSGRLVQVGVRTSAHGRAHWESILGVRQFWAQEVRDRGESQTIDDIIAHLQAKGCKRLYFSNDIDGTDAALAPSTGAPEIGGLSADFVRELITRLGDTFALLGADLVEVAPPVGSRSDSQKTLAVGASYLMTSLKALLNGRTL